jgi:hypothetical protein
LTAGIEKNPNLLEYVPLIIFGLSSLLIVSVAPMSVSPDKESLIIPEILIADCCEYKEVYGMINIKKTNHIKSLYVILIIHLK